MTDASTTDSAAARLNDFDPAVRGAALHELLREQQEPPVQADEVANMHCHTFFSFNAYGHSPTSLAWLARQRGYKLMGTVDFDVLDGVDEFLQACDLTGVRGSTGIETRVYFPEFDRYEMNSPGEPGVLYHMGIGFATSDVSVKALEILAELRDQSAQRNLGMIDRVNAHLDPVMLDYEQDVLPLTPNGNATERHIVVAYIRVAELVYPARAERERFWAARLDLTQDQVAQLMDDAAAFQNQVRSRLMKRGGVGYVQPGHDTFPPIDKLNLMIVESRALPCAAWLDGTTSGEQHMDELLALLVDKGAAALNIVPDRNWDIADPDVRSVKLQKLYDVAKLAQEMDLPLNVGTEMNSYGQKLVDEFDAPALQPLRQAFIDGAYFIYGHTVMERRLGLGYQSDWAQDQLPTRRERNQFYAQLGFDVPPGKPGVSLLHGITSEYTPREILARVGNGHMASE